MAGLLASGITLAGLFKTCLDAIDLIQTVPAARVGPEEAGSQTEHREV
jgi:hypothetical protein